MQAVAPEHGGLATPAGRRTTGVAVYEDQHGMTFWQWLAANPEDEAVFNASMARRGAAQVAAIRRPRPLRRRLVVDVGGGKGAMLAALLEQEPSLRGIVADRPEVAAEATAALAAAGLGAARAWRAL